MPTDDGSTHLDFDYSDDEPTRRFIDPRLGDAGQVDESDDDSKQPLGTLIQYHNSAASDHNTAPIGKGARSACQTLPRDVESCTALRARKDVRTQDMAVRMERAGIGLERRRRDEEKRDEIAWVVLLLALGFVLGMLLVSMVWPNR